MKIQWVTHARNYIGEFLNVHMSRGANIDLSGTSYNPVGILLAIGHF